MLQKYFYPRYFSKGELKTGFEIGVIGTGVISCFGVGVGVGIGIGVGVGVGT